MADINENEEFFDPEVYTLTDEDGVEGQYEEIGVAEVDDKVYHALVLLDDEGEPVGDEYIILRETQDDEGELFLESIDDDDEFDRIADLFEDEFASIDYDEGSGE